MHVQILRAGARNFEGMSAGMKEARKKFFGSQGRVPAEKFNIFSKSSISTPEGRSKPYGREIEISAFRRFCLLTRSCGAGTAPNAPKAAQTGLPAQLAPPLEPNPLRQAKIPKIFFFFFKSGYLEIQAFSEKSF